MKKCFFIKRQKKFIEPQIIFVKWWHFFIKRQNFFVELQIFFVEWQIFFVGREIIFVKRQIFFCRTSLINEKLWPYTALESLTFQKFSFVDTLLLRGNIVLPRVHNNQCVICLSQQFSVSGHFWLNCDGPFWLKIFWYFFRYYFNICVHIWPENWSSSVRLHCRCASVTFVKVFQNPFPISFWN